MRRLLSGLAACLLPAALAAQGGVHVLVATGLSVEPAAAKRFRESAGPVVSAARQSWGVTDSSLFYLTENAAVDPRATGISNAASIDSAVRRIQRRAAPGDLVLIMLVGHGSGEREESKVSLPGPDLTAKEYAALLDRLAAQRVVFIVAASGSGDFIPVLSGKDRVVITATKSALERNESLFSLWIGQGLADPAADADKDGTISVLEAFTFARTQLERQYVDTKRMQTEHPLLDDNADKQGIEEPDAKKTGIDGALAARVTFGGAGATNPKIAALMAERRVLEQAVDDLKTKKSFMPPADYDRELERLLLAIAEKSAEIRALTPAVRP